MRYSDPFVSRVRASEVSSLGVLYVQCFVVQFIDLTSLLIVTLLLLLLLFKSYTECIIDRKKQTNKKCHENTP